MAALSARGAAARALTSKKKETLANDGCYIYQPRIQFAFTGDIASLAGPDGSHFLGKDDPNIVIGLDSTGTQNIGRDIPLDPELL